MAVIDITRKENNLPETIRQCNEFDTIDLSEISYTKFFYDYLIPNTPCVIKQITLNWSCQQEWVTDGKPNFDFLRRKYGASQVPAADCNDRYFNSQSKRTMPFKGYLDYWESYIASGYPATSPSLYLKDWHFFREHPDEKVYHVPFPFVSDWLNEYYLCSPQLEDDYRFVYMGPKGTWTPLHKDVFSSFSWSVNLCGTKEWWFYPPGEEALLKDSLGNLAYDVTSPESLSKCHLSRAKRIRLIQHQGDAVFVPSGWFHQVWNSADTISINHNWINGCNIRDFYENLQEELVKVEKELSDCKKSAEWPELCQNLLRASFGFHTEDLLNLVECIVERRIECLKSGQPLLLPCGSLIGLNQIKFDLTSAIPVLSLLAENNECKRANEFLSTLLDLT